MINYSFETISPVEFEEMCSSLLCYLTGLHFERFKEGKDGGVDLRNGSTIFQCKRYRDFNSLFHTLENSEVDKVKNRLKPSRYGIMTSCPLSPKDKSRIRNLFAPFITADSDIIGREELNDLLSRPDNSWIVDKTLGLWWQSFDRLKRTLSNGVLGRSAFRLGDFEKKNRFTYWTMDMERAYLALLKSRVIILEGKPGVGKTTIAQMIALKMVYKSCEMVVVRDGIKEAEDVWDESKTQLFYCDDFLGSNYREAISDSQSSGICDFISRVVASDNKYLILTSRTHILRNKEYSSVPLKKIHLSTSPYCYCVESLDDVEKAHILYYRILAADVSPHVKSSVTFKRAYHAIIHHKNFNPRLIEAVFQNASFEDTMSEQQVLGEIYRLMDNPVEVWGSVFENQLSERAIAIIWAIFLADRLSDITIKDLYLNYGGEEREYNSTMEMLSGTLVDRLMDESGNVYFRINNPAIGDYLIANVKDYLRLIGNVLVNIVNKHASKKYFEITHLKRDVLPLDVIRQEGMRILSILDSGSSDGKDCVWIFVAELLDLFYEEIYEEVLPIIRRHADDDYEWAEYWVSTTIDKLDLIDSEKWLQKSGISLDSYVISILMAGTDSFTLCARLVQIAKKNKIFLEYDLISNPLTMRLGEYVVNQIIPNIDCYDFEIESYGHWSIPDYEEDRISQEIIRQIESELSYYDIPNDMVDIDGIIGALDYKDYFYPNKGELSQYVEYDRESAIYSRFEREEKEDTDAKIDELFESLH